MDTEVFSVLCRGEQNHYPVDRIMAPRDIRVLITPGACEEVTLCGRGGGSAGVVMLRLSRGKGHPGLSRQARFYCRGLCEGQTEASEPEEEV